MDYNSQPGGYNNGPPQQGYNPGYAASNISGAPPGIMNSGMSQAGGTQSPSYNNAGYQQTAAGGGGGGCCYGGCIATTIRSNPYVKVNQVTDDVYYNARYKRAMTVGGIIILASFVGGAIVSSAGCAFIGFFSLLHFIPVFAPTCNNTLPPFYWACISIGSVIASVVSLFFGLIQNCALEAAVMAGIIIALEAILFFLLYKMDPLIKDKVKVCFASCGCFGEQAQLQTMIPKESGYPTTSPSVMNQQYQNYDNASYAGSSPGAFNTNTGANAFGTNNNTLRSNGPPAPPASQGGLHTGRNSGGKGSFFLDAPDNFDTGSRPGN